MENRSIFKKRKRTAEEAEVLLEQKTVSVMGLEDKNVQDVIEKMIRCGIENQELFNIIKERPQHALKFESIYERLFFNLQFKVADLVTFFKKNIVEKSDKSIIDVQAIIERLAKLGWCQTYSSFSSIFERQYYGYRFVPLLTRENVNLIFDKYYGVIPHILKKLNEMSDSVGDSRVNPAQVKFDAMLTAIKKSSLSLLCGFHPRAGVESPLFRLRQSTLFDYRVLRLPLEMSGMSKTRRTA